MSQELLTALACVVPCLWSVLLLAIGILIGKRGVPHLTWGTQSGGKPAAVSLLKSRTLARDLEPANQTNEREY